LLDDINIRMSHVRHPDFPRKDPDMSSVIYIVGLVVVILAVLSFFGLR
jgi:hypothetical protein